MILISFLIVTIKSEISLFDESSFNISVPCKETISLSNVLFYDMIVPVINCCRSNSISFDYCSFSEVSSIINSNFQDLNSFTFTNNCCYNDKTESNQSYIKLFSQTCQFRMNTLSGFSSNNKSDFIFFESPTIQITNINLTNNARFISAICIVNSTNELHFNDITFDRVQISTHIHISGAANKYSVDRLNDNGNSPIFFMKTENDASFIITRVYMPNKMEISATNSFIWFVDSYLPGLRYPNVGPNVPGPGSIVIDSLNNISNSYFINHLAVSACPTNDILTIELPKRTMGKSMKVKIAFSFIGGALFGVAIFLIIYFAVKYSIKCYQKKQDQEHPVFDI